MGPAKATPRRFAIVTAMAASVLGACLFPTTESFSGGGGGDASVNADVTGVPDVLDASDATVSDAGGDGSIKDAGLCVGALFCDEFERPGLLGSWTSIQKNAATVDIFADTLGSHLRYAYSGVDASGSGPSGYLQKDALSAGKHAIVDFDAYVDVGSGFFNVVGLQFIYGANIAFTAGFQVSTVAGGALAQVYDLGTNVEISYDGTPFAKIPPQKKWFHGSLEINVVGGKGQVSASVDGAPMATAVTPGNVQSGPLTVFAGCIYSSSPKGSGTILVDNVRVVALP